MRELSISGTALIIVPHSDDEVLLFGGLIQRRLAEKKPVFVALVTNGDYEAHSEQEGQTRPAETLAALSLLGLPDENVFLLGYADTGMPRSESFLAGLYDDKDGDHVHPSRVGIHTYGLPAHPDYHTGRYGAPALYTRNALIQDLSDVIQEVEPQAIFTTHPLDAHGDHEALFYFVREAAKGQLIYAAFAHSRKGDIPLPESTEEIPCPDDLLDSWQTAVGLTLTPSELERKRRALELHISALKPDACDFLRSFVKRNEFYFTMEATAL